MHPLASPSLPSSTDLLCQGGHRTRTHQELDPHHLSRGHDMHLLRRSFLCLRDPPRPNSQRLGLVPHFFGDRFRRFSANKWLWRFIRRPPTRSMGWQTGFRHSGRRFPIPIRQQLGLQRCDIRILDGRRLGCHGDHWLLSHINGNRGPSRACKSRETNNCSDSNRCLLQPYIPSSRSTDHQLVGLEAGCSNLCFGGFCRSASSLTLRQRRSLYRGTGSVT